MDATKDQTIAVSMEQLKTACRQWEGESRRTNPLYTPAESIEHVAEQNSQNLWEKLQRAGGVVTTHR